MIGAALAASCNSNNDSTTPRPSARNVIFFLGDGMGLNTLTAARISRRRGRTTSPSTPCRSGLHQDLLPRCPGDRLGPSMAAYMTGVKSNNGVISMDGDTTQGERLQPGGGKPVTTLLELAKADGRGTGVVTSTRVTHAAGRHLCPYLQPGSGGRTSPSSWYRAVLANSALKRGWTWCWGAAAASSCPPPTRASVPIACNLIAEMQAKGYQFANNLDELNRAGQKAAAGAVRRQPHEVRPGQAGQQPSLAQMTLAAIK